jgi:hypothetical protein
MGLHISITSHTNMPQHSSANVTTNPNKGAWLRAIIIKSVSSCPAELCSKAC